MGAYVDDATITTQVKSRFVESKEVDAGAISVETMKGTVMLSGFAKSVLEKNSAERIARGCERGSGSEERSVGAPLNPRV